MTDPTIERRQPWWKGQVTVGNVAAIAAFIFGLGLAQARSEFAAAAIAQRVGAVESRLDRGDFMRADVAEEKLESIKGQIANLKESVDNGFARVERAVR